MAIAVNDLWAGGDPDLDELSINEHTMPGEAQLREVITADESKLLTELELEMRAACGASELYVDQHGDVDDALVNEAKKHNRAYQNYREGLFKKHPALDADVSRGDFNPKAPGKVGEVLGKTTMVASAAMGMLLNPRGGYAKGLEDLNGSVDHRFGIMMARRYGLPILGYDATIDDLTSYIHAIRTAPRDYTEPVFARMNTSVSRARELLMGQTHDAAIFIKDDSGKLRALVSRSDVGLDRHGRVSNSNGVVPNRDIGTLDTISRDGQIITAKQGISIAEAKALMKHHRIRQLPILDEQGNVRHKLTRLDVLHSEGLAKFKLDGPMNVGVAIGVSNSKDMIARAEAAIEAGAVFLTFETAHAYRRDVIRKFQDTFMPAVAEALSPAEEKAIIESYAKDIQATIEHIKGKYKDRPILIGFGTVTSPEAVRLLEALGVDVVKVGIGGGGQCTTFDATGVGGPPFRYCWDCGKAAAALGIQIMADGSMNSRRRTGTMAGVTGTGLLQIGTWFGSTAEAASPAELNDNGEWVKETYGEASQRAIQIRAEAQGKEVDEDDDLANHAEGKVVMAKMAHGQFGTVGGIMLGVVQAMASTASYVDAKNMKQYQKNARIRRITKTATSKA